MYSKKTTWADKTYDVPDLQRTARLFAQTIGTEVDEDRWGVDGIARLAICKNGKLVCAKPVWLRPAAGGYADSVVVAATGTDGFLASIDGKQIAPARYLGGSLFELDNGSLV